MFFSKGKARNTASTGAGGDRGKAEEIVDKFVARAQEDAFNRLVSRAHRTAYDDYEDRHEGRMKLVGVAVAVGLVAFTAGRFVPIQEPIRGQTSSTHSRAPETVTLRVIENERPRNTFDAEKAEPDSLPVAPPQDMPAPAFSVCPPETARTAGALDARRRVAAEVFGNVVPIRVTLGSNGKESVRVFTTIAFYTDGKARNMGSKAFAAKKGTVDYVSAHVEPELGRINVSPPLESCVLGFVNTIPPG
jgi:hypothetical protein